jgi:hypothetical protein
VDQRRGRHRRLRSVMDAPKAGAPCPECGEGKVRLHMAPGGQRHKYCSKCNTVWMLSNFFARRAKTC